MPSLHFHYRNFFTTTHDSAPVFCFGIFSLRGASTCDFPLTSKYRFPSSILKPISKSCPLYAGCRLVSNKGNFQTYPRPTICVRVLTTMVSVSTPHQGFICIHLFDTHLTQSLVAVPFPLSLTTKALYSSSRGRFVTNSFQSITRDLLSSLEQLRTTSLFSWHTNVTLFTVSWMRLL